MFPSKRFLINFQACFRDENNEWCYASINYCSVKYPEQKQQGDVMKTASAKHNHGESETHTY